jgi:hypothetical protein
MKAFAVSFGLLIGLAGAGCSEEDVRCDGVQDCKDAGFRCPSGEDLFCDTELDGVCACEEGAGGSGGSAGTGGSAGSAGASGMGGAGGAESCALDLECDPFEIFDCDTPCQAFCGPGGTEVYGSCLGYPDPSMAPFLCVCSCGSGTDCP